MNIAEWPLIIFTTLAQMSVGSFIVLGVMHFYARRKAGEEEADRLSDRALLAIGPVLVLGLMASILHLGNPVDATRAVANVGSSWLSREILFGVLFAALGFLFAIAQWRKIGSIALRNALAILTAIVGLALVYSMSMVYMLETQPSWNTWTTTALFFISTFLLGSLAMGTALMANYAYLKRKDASCAETQCELLGSVVYWIAAASVILLGIELVVIALQLLLVGGSSIPEAIESITLTLNQYGLIFAARLVLVFLGAGVFALYVYRNASRVGREPKIAYAIVGAFLLVLAAEIMGRYLFYATQIGIGI